VRYVQQRFWGRSYAVFDVEREFRAPACSGFSNPPEERAQEHRSWMRTDVSAPGPMAAAAALRMLAAEGTKIYLAEIPTHPRLAALQTEKIPSDRVIALHALDAEANFEPFHSPVDIPTTAFCDFAHISPEQAGKWLRPLFGRIVADRQIAESNTADGSIRSAGTAVEAGLFLKSR
jgi:hypothetical protein